jgi:hypothetical protein
MRAESSTANFDAKLEAAKVEGVAGRRELLNRLARLPIDRIVSLPAKSLAILGPRGLAQLAAIREELAGTGRKTDVRTSLDTAPSTTIRSRGRLRPIRSGFIVVVAILATGLLVDMVRPIFVAAFLDSGIRPRDASHWAACSRLDQHIDGCIYTTGSRNLTLARVADLTAIPLPQLIAANPDLRTSTQAPLPKGRAILIWRGRLALEGSPR